jgi:hypothetical protein
MYDALHLLLIERKFTPFCPFCTGKSKKIKKIFGPEIQQ